jgi:hypothetical protein
MLGRYVRLRDIRGEGPPYIFDRWRNSIRPAEGEEWWRSPEGMWIPIPRGGIGFDASKSLHPQFGFGTTTYDGTIFETALTLNTAYVAGSAGVAGATRIKISEDKTLSNTYYFIKAFTGNPTTIDFELRSGTLSAPTMTGGGLIEAKVHNPGGVVGWHKITGWTTALTASDVYWLVFADADGSGSNNAQVVVRYDLDDSRSTYGRWMAASSTNGFSSISRQTDPGGTILQFSDDSVIGHPFIATLTPASANTQRGLYIPSIDKETRIYAIYAQRTQSYYSGVRIWKGATGPSGDPVTGGGLNSNLVVSDIDVNGNPLGAIFPVYTLEPETEYRFVMTYGANGGEPRQLSCHPTSDATIRALMPGRGTWAYTQDVASAWADNDSLYPLMTIMIDDFIEGSGGGSGISKGRVIAGG